MDEHQSGFMRRAIEIARQSLEMPGTLPYGAVVVMNGEIVGEGLNRARALHDPTSHGEVDAIRDACRRLGTHELNGCDLYTSCEPCPMCVATMHVAGIERLYYASTAKESAEFFARLAENDPKWQRRRLSGDALRREVGLPVERRAMPCEQLLGDLGQALFEDFITKNT